MRPMYDEEDDAEGFHTALLREDELGAVIRAQIYLEHDLIAFVRARLTNADALSGSDLSYARLVRLAIALGLPARFERPLTAFARIRNGFAHRLDTALTSKTVHEFVGSFSDEMKRDADAGIGSIHFLGVTGNTKEALTPRGLFIMYAYYLWIMLSEEIKGPKGQP
jgi:hypothetical protein